MNNETRAMFMATLILLVLSSFIVHTSYRMQEQARHVQSSSNR